MGAECPARGTVTDIYIYHIGQRLAPLLFLCLEVEEIPGQTGNDEMFHAWKKSSFFSAKVLKINLLLSLFFTIL